MIKKNKRKFLSIIFIFLIAIAYILYIQKDYNIENNNISIEKAIINNYKLYKPQIKKTLDIKDRKIVVFVYDSKYIGLSILKWGFNNKYKIINTSYTDSRFFRSTTTTNDYHDTIVIAGRNYNSLADKIKFKITSYDQDKEKQQSNYEKTLPDDEFFIITEKFPMYRETFISDSTTAFLDKNNNNITKELYDYHKKYPYINTTQ